MIKIKSLRWDEWNTNHIKRHGVLSEEVEEVCKGIYQQQPTYKNRFLILGKTIKGRALTIVLAKEKLGLYYPITARDMSQKERRRFLK